MKSRNRTFAVIAALALPAAAAVLYYATASDATPSSTPQLAGLAAGMRFTDGQGNARTPSAEERAALAAAFQEDIANLTRNRNIPQGSRRERSGAISAVVGAEKLRFLTVTVGDDGQLDYGHARLRENGRIEAAASEDLPEM